MNFNTFVSWLDVDEEYEYCGRRYKPDFNENISFHRPIVCTKKGVVGTVVVRKLASCTGSTYCMLSYGYLIPEECVHLLGGHALYLNDRPWVSGGYRNKDCLYNESILAFFKTCRDAKSACLYAAEEISKEVEEATTKNIPSIYFSTHFLTTDYTKLWPFAFFRPDGDTGWAYNFQPRGRTSLFDRYYSYIQRNLGIPDCSQNKMVVYRCFLTSYSDVLPPESDNSCWNMILNELRRYGIPDEIKKNVIMPGAEYGVSDEIEEYLTIGDCGTRHFVIDETKDTSDLNIIV